MNVNAEQRFDAMHLEHDLIIDMVSRLRGADDDGKQHKQQKSSSIQKMRSISARLRRPSDQQCRSATRTM
jgi:hypothetical protein